jgi:hypothetical protein
MPKEKVQPPPLAETVRQRESRCKIYRGRSVERNGRIVGTGNQILRVLGGKERRQ